MKCLCGCGLEVKNPKYKYVLKHYKRLREKMGSKLCLCGCGQLTKLGNRYINGHNVKINNPMSNSESVKKMIDIRNKNGYHEKKSKSMKEFNPLNTPESIRKKKETWMKKYGVDNPQKSKEIKMKSITTCRERGIYKKLSEKLKVDNPSRRPEVRKKLSDANMDWDFYNLHGIRKSRYPYHENFTGELKREVRERDGNCCVITGMTNEEHRTLYGGDLVVHHWTYNKDETNLYFFITVARPINAMANTDQEAWMAFFGGIIETGFPWWKMLEVID